jgi:hypothetical protein
MMNIAFGKNRNKISKELQKSVLKQSNNDKLYNFLYKDNTTKKLFGEVKKIKICKDKDELMGFVKKINYIIHCKKEIEEVRKYELGDLFIIFEINNEYSKDDFKEIENWISWHRHFNHHILVTVNEDKKIEKNIIFFKIFCLYQVEAIEKSFLGFYFKTIYNIYTENMSIMKNKIFHNVIKKTIKPDFKIVKKE